MIIDGTLAAITTTSYSQRKDKNCLFHSNCDNSVGIVLPYQKHCFDHYLQFAIVEKRESKNSTSTSTKTYSRCDPVSPVTVTSVVVEVAVAVVVEIVVADGAHMNVVVDNAEAHDVVRLTVDGRNLYVGVWRTKKPFPPRRLLLHDMSQQQKFEDR